MPDQPEVTDARLLTPQEQEWQALADAATPGPWRHVKSLGRWMCWLLAPPQNSDLPDGYPLCDFRGTDATANFIAAARTAVPSLLQALTEAREHADKMDGQASDFQMKYREATELLTEARDHRASAMALYAESLTELATLKAELTEARRERDEAIELLRKLGPMAVSGLSSRLAGDHGHVPGARGQERVR